jgi:metabolite-proton symporter
MAMASDFVSSGVSRRRIVAASLIGTTIEWYDFFLYGAAAALVFNKLFFPVADPLTGAMLAFSTYALGFVTRPIGGLVFGHFGDRIGRKRLLMISLLLMGVSTVLIGFLPTYAQAGYLAPGLLLLLRLAQGFAVGGEWGGAVLLVAEHTEAKNRGFWAGWPQVGVPAGNLLAAGVLAILAMTQSEAAFLAWGWRIPFLLSAVLIAIGWWVRMAVNESPLFEQARRLGQIHSAPAIEVFKRRPRALAIGAGIRLAENISFYIITAFSITYATTVVKISRGVALDALALGAAVELASMPLFSWLSDRIGRRPVYALGAAGMGIWAFSFFKLLDTGATPAVMVAIVVGLILHGAMYGPQASFLAELFPTNLRYCGMSLTSQATSIVAGSLAPIIAIALLQWSHSALPIAIYIAAACAISVGATLLARETKGLTFAQLDL